MRAYIHKMAGISVLNSFDQGVLHALNNTNSQTLIEPPYKDIIPGSYLRRMSKVIKMGVATALRVLKDEEVQGIIVGSGAGCCYNTVLFIDEFYHRPTGVLSPNSFIQSTDNTIAGQIALITKNNSYNITYIQKGLSFENALLDALLLVNEIDGKVLVGGVDEWINKFGLNDDVREKHPEFWIGEGAGFFIVGPSEEHALAQVNSCGLIHADALSVEEKIQSYLSANQLKSPDLILYGNSFVNSTPLQGNIMGVKTIHYDSICGIYFTNSSFALQMATEILSLPDQAKIQGWEAKNILIVNNFFDVDFGLTYVSSI